MLPFPDVLSIRAKCFVARTSNGLSTSPAKTDRDWQRRNIWEGLRPDRAPVLASDGDFQHPNRVAEQLTRSLGLSTHINHTQHLSTFWRMCACVCEVWFYGSAWDKSASKNKNSAYVRSIERRSDFWILVYDWLARVLSAHLRYKLSRWLKAGGLRGGRREGTVLSKPQKKREVFVHFLAEWTTQWGKHNGPGGNKAVYPPV